jgi:C4-dicarboxylate transporter DctM subunit
MIPLFILMGELAFYGGLSKDAFTTLHKWVGHLRGGLAIATVGACAAFGAVCGSHVATAATMCSVALPEMRRYKYQDELSLGSICAGGNLGFLIPPSAAFVVYGFITQVSIGSLFISGIIPGLLITFLFWIQIYIQCMRNPALAPLGPQWSWQERFKSLKGIWGILIIFIIVIGGIYSGVFTPTESAAVGVFAVFIIGLAARQLTFQQFHKSLISTVKTSAIIFFLIIGAMVFSSFLTTTEFALGIGSYIETLQVDRYVIMIAILIVYIIAGFFLDIFAVLMITLPISHPILVLSLGFDPVHFGVLCVVTIMIGAITPPVGVVVFAISGMVRDVHMYTIFRGCMPFVVTMIIALAILLVFPELSTFLPSLMLPYK